jgi:hypothetical protein
VSVCVSVSPPTLDRVIEFDRDVVAATRELYLRTLGPIDFEEGFTPAAPLRAPLVVRSSGTRARGRQPWIQVRACTAEEGLL